MPVLSNPKHEQFAIGLADGLKTLDAYENAGYPRSPSSASQLKARPEIQARVQELISDHQSRASREGDDDPDALPSDLNREWLIKTLMKNVAIAQNAQQIAPANKAVEMLAEIIGFSLKKRGALGDKAEEDEQSGSPQNFDFDKANDAIGRMMEALPSKGDEK